MRRLYYILFILLVFTSTIFPSIERVAVAEDAEFYVYEIRSEGKVMHDETPFMYRYVVKLVRLSNDVFKLELLSAEPESFKEHLEEVFKASSFQLKLTGPYNISIDNTVIYYYSPPHGSLPFFDVGLFWEPELVKLACEKASKVNETANKLIDAWKKGLQEDFRRLSMLFYELKGEYIAIKLVTDFPLYLLPSIIVEAKDFEFKLTSTCLDYASVIRIAYRMVEKYREDEENKSIEVVYSSTGWLIYAKYQGTKTYLPSKMTIFSYVREIRLIETTNEKLLKDMQMFSRGASAQWQLERLTNPLVIGLIIVSVSITVSVIFLLRKRKF